MTTDFPTAPLAPGHKGAGGGTVEKSHHASHTEFLTPPLPLFFVSGSHRSTLVFSNLVSTLLH